MKYLHLPVGEVIKYYWAKWKRTSIRSNDSTYKDNYYYMPIECYCDVTGGSGYTYDEESGACDYCKSVIRQINGHSNTINVNFDDDNLFK